MCEVDISFSIHGHFPTDNGKPGKYICLSSQGHNLKLHTFEKHS